MLILTSADKWIFELRLLRSEVNVSETVELSDIPAVIV